MLVNIEVLMSLKKQMGSCFGKSEKWVFKLLGRTVVIVSMDECELGEWQSVWCPFLLKRVNLSVYKFWGWK